MRSQAWLTATFLVALAASGSSAQIPDTLLSGGTVLARFDEARALAIDTRGFLYVADAGRDVILKMEADGTPVASVGGPGAEHGQFDQPADLDATNGLVWVVADKGNGRVQRFSGSFLHMETLPVLRADRFMEAVPEPGHGIGDGYPTAVATSPSSEIFVIEELDGLLLKWDAARRPERVIGGFGRGAGALKEPVALAADEQRLYVADRSHAAVLVFDHFGGLIRMIARGEAKEVRALSVVEGSLWIVLPEAILAYTLEGVKTRVIGVQIGEDLVDAQPHADVIYLLTATRLVHAAR